MLPVIKSCKNIISRYKQGIQYWLLMTLFPEHYPEEYIEWSVDFFGKTYRISPDVLIPRLETECLIRRARKIIQEENIRQVIDIGCGSGIIGTSVADLVDRVVFLDISPEALRMTQGNFETNFPNKKAQFILSDLLSELPLTIQSNSLFLTNLPYIKDADWKNMSPDTIFEPKLALFGGEKTGFELYEKLFRQFQWMNFSQTHTCIFEFWFDQREYAEKIITTQYPTWKYSFFPDYAGIERFWEIIFGKNP